MHLLWSSGTEMRDCRVSLGCASPFLSVQNFLDGDMRSRAEVMRREVAALEKAFSCVRSVAANKVARAQGKGRATRLDKL